MAGSPGEKVASRHPQRQQQASLLPMTKQQDGRLDNRGSNQTVSLSGEKTASQPFHRKTKQQDGHLIK